MGLKLKDYFVFDGESSADFGFFASGENVYNSPEKDYEIFEVPGRNGSVMIDNNRFKNVTVKYPCYYEKTGGNLTKDISDFRNMLLSKSGYQRLFDTHNPDEYRLAVCRNVIETDPTEYDLLGAVEIEFDCKPQRYLVSGETPVEIASGSKLVNPTNFDARPLIAVSADDSADLYVNETLLMFRPDDVGELALQNSRPYGSTVGKGSFSYSAQSTWSESYYNSLDVISANDDIYIRIEASGFPSVEGYNVGGLADDIIEYVSVSTRGYESIEFAIKIKKSALSFEALQRKIISFEFYAIVEYKTDPASATYGSVLDFSGTLTYRGAADGTGTVDSKILNFVHSGTVEPLENGNDVRIKYTLESFPQFSVYSTKSALANEVFFDAEACEAYTYGDDGKIMSINSAVITGPDYPKLTPGGNDIKFYGGIDSCKIIPRWWKI